MTNSALIHQQNTEQTMPILVSSTIAIALYVCASLYLGLQLRQHPKLKVAPLLALSALALFFHGMASCQWIATVNGLDFSLLPMSTAIFFTVNLIVLLSSLRKPLHNLFLLLFPMTAILLLITLTTTQPTALSTNISTGIGAHIVLSVLAYSLLTIASCQALLLARQNWRLRHKHLGGWLQKALPPLQTMEELLFEILWSGFILLSLSLLTGLLFVDDFFAQHLLHKTVLSIMAWVFYGVLLWGHHVKGWRGNTAIRWTLGGFFAIVLAYSGSKFVLEVLLT